MGSRQPESREEAAELVHAVSNGPDATGVRRRPGLILLRVDADGVIAVAEGMGLGMLGMCPSELEGRPVSEAFDRCGRLVEGAKKATRGEASSTSLELRGVPFDVRFEPRPRERGAGALVMARAPRAHDEPGWREVRMLLDQVPGVVWATDRDLRLTHIAGRLPTLLEVDPQELTGGRLDRLLGARDTAPPLEAHRRVLRTGEDQALRHELRGRWLEIQIEALRDASGRIAGCVGAAIDVTARRRAEAELARSRARLAEAQRVAHVGSFEWDVASNRIVWSEELYRIYGIEPGEFGGRLEDYLAIVHPNDLAEVERTVGAVLRERRPFQQDFRAVRPDGAVRTIRTQGDVVTSPQGEVVRMVGSCWDVTELAEATEQLERSVSLLQATLEATADGVLVMCRSGRVTLHNGRFLDLWEVPEALVERRDGEGLLSHMRDQLSDPEQDFDDGDVLRLRAGRVYERHSQPQRIGDEVVGQVWSFHDVTDRERLLLRAQFLADASRLLTTLDVEPALDGVARLAVPHVGHGCAIDLLGDDGPRRLVSVHEPGSTPPGEAPPAAWAGQPTLNDAGGTSRVAAPLIAKGELLGVLTLAAAPDTTYDERDLELAQELARRMALAVENARLYAAARDALRARDELFAVAAHEIRGPLMSLHLAVQSLASGTLSEAENRRLLQIIERDDRRLSRFIDELLDVGRLRSGQLQLELEPVDLAVVVHDVVSWLGADISRSGSPVSIRTAGSAVGTWDRFRLDQVVQNLVSNAIKFGQGEPIEISVTADDSRATLVVRDHGLGIPGERKEAIFEPFERRVSARHYGGLGLGLHIVQTVVSAFGGTVRVESEPGAGAEFVVELPK